VVVSSIVASEAGLLASLLRAGSMFSRCEDIELIGSVLNIRGDKDGVQWEGAVELGTGVSEVSGFLCGRRRYRLDLSVM
jgi:hypothetical protein